MLLEIFVQKFSWFLIGCLWPIIFFISTGISIFCSKKKPLTESKTPLKGSASVKKNINESDQPIPNQSSQVEAPKKEKSKTKSEHVDSKQKKSVQPDPPQPQVQAEGKPDAGGTTESKVSSKPEAPPKTKETENQSKSKVSKSKVSEKKVEESDDYQQVQFGPSDLPPPPAPK